MFGRSLGLSNVSLAFTHNDLQNGTNDGGWSDELEEKFTTSLEQELDKVHLQDKEREQVCIASTSSLTISNLIYVSRLNPPCIASWISFLPLGKPSTSRSRRRSMTWLR